MSKPIPIEEVNCDGLTLSQPKAQSAIKPDGERIDYLRFYINYFGKKCNVSLGKIRFRINTSKGLSVMAFLDGSEGMKIADSIDKIHLKMCEILIDKYRGKAGIAPVVQSAQALASGGSFKSPAFRRVDESTGAYVDPPSATMFLKIFRKTAVFQCITGIDAKGNPIFQQIPVDKLIGKDCVGVIDCQIGNVCKTVGLTLQFIASVVTVCEINDQVSAADDPHVQKYVSSVSQEELDNLRAQVANLLGSPSVLSDDVADDEKEAPDDSGGVSLLDPENQSSADKILNLQKYLENDQDQGYEPLVMPGIPQSLPSASAHAAGHQ